MKGILTVLPFISDHLTCEEPHDQTVKKRQGQQRLKDRNRQKQKKSSGETAEQQMC